MPKPVEVKALANYRIWLRYDDGTEGNVDLADLAGRGVFKAWDAPTFFSAVRIASHGAVEWGSGLDLCPDALYLRLTGWSPKDLFPALARIWAEEAERRADALDAGSLASQPADDVFREARARI